MYLDSERSFIFIIYYDMIQNINSYIYTYV